MASYINTGFKSRNNLNKDLIDIFEPHFGPILDYQTKYKSVQNANLDLNNIFQLYTDGDLSANLTNFTTYDGTTKVDLNSVFRRKKTDLPNFPRRADSTLGRSVVSCCMYDKYAIIITGNDIFYSADYGATYVRSFPIPSISGSLVDCCIFGYNAIVISARSVLYSSNCGQTWSLTTSGLPVSGQNYRSCSICDNYAILANGLNGMYGSSNNGETWVNLNAPVLDWDRVFISKTGTIGNYTYIAIASYTVDIGSRQIYYSSNFTGTIGTSFIISSTIFNFDITSLSLSGQRGILCIPGFGNGIYYTINGGQTWTKTSSSILPGINLCSLSNAIDASFNTTYVGIASGSAYVYISKDGGQTWSIVSNVNNFEYCAISNSNVIVYNNGSGTLDYMHYGKV
jgi:hypothetical protein